MVMNIIFSMLIIATLSGKVILEVQGPDGLRMDIQHGLRQGNHVSGWTSEYYGECSTRPTVEITGNCMLPVRFVTHICLD